MCLGSDPQLVVLCSNNLHENSLASTTVEFVIEDVFPRPKVQHSFGDCDDDFSAHDLAFVVGICIVFARSIVQVTSPSRVSSGVEWHQLFQPTIVVLVETAFIVVDEDRRRDVHGVDEAKPFLNTTFCDQVFDVVL